MSIISEPNQYLVIFYYYYSYATLWFCWVLAVPLFYIVITQSKRMKTIKWLIINHSFWCLALETLLGLVKPLFMSPCAGGIQIGMFKDHGSFVNTALAALVCLALTTNCVMSLTATIATRYLHVFPSKLTIWLSLRNCLIFMAVSCFLTYAFLIMTFLPALIVDTETIHEWAEEYDPYLAKFFPEPSFFLIPHMFLDRVVAFVIALISILIIAFFSFSIFFVYLIFKYQKKSKTNFQKSLITSSIIQIYLTIIFLFSPILAFFLFISFDIPHTATAMCFFMCLLMTHGLLEFIATLYFILPYRQYILKRFNMLSVQRHSYQVSPSYNRQVSMIATLM